MKVAITDNRKLPRPLYIRGLKYILSSGKKTVVEVDDAAIEKLEQLGFLTIERIEEVKVEEVKEEEVKAEEKVSEIVSMDQLSPKDIEGESELEPSTLEPSTLEPSTLEPSTLESPTPEPSTPDTDYTSLTVQQLKDLLIAHGVDTAGAKKKRELLDLVEQHIK